MIQLIAGSKCSYEDCDKAATHIACGRSPWKGQKWHPTPALYCEEHSVLVADEGSPEYNVDCPNCGCQFGVN